LDEPVAFGVNVTEVALTDVVATDVVPLVAVILLVAPPAQVIVKDFVPGYAVLPDLFVTSVLPSLIVVLPLACVTEHVNEPVLVVKFEPVT
jgi:hypothetical protein